MIYVNDDFAGICDTCNDLVVNVKPGDIVRVSVHYDNHGDDATLSLTPPAYITDGKPQSAEILKGTSGTEDFRFRIKSTYSHPRDLKLSIVDQRGSGMSLAPDICKFYSPPSNEPPTVESFRPVPPSPQRVGTTVRWTAKVSDPDGDVVYCRFGINSGDGFQGIEFDWSPQAWWEWTPTQPGTYQATVLVRDGKHAPSHLYDDYKIAEITITK